MNPTKSMLTIGIVFLISGAVFLAIGTVTQMLAFSVLGPSFMALGVVFLATSKVHANRKRTQQAGPDSDALALIQAEAASRVGVVWVRDSHFQW